MDATMQTVLRLHEQGIPRRTIAKRAGISLQKVRKILITAGAWSDETSEKIGKLRANGMSVPEIAEELGVKTNTVWSYLPYSKGMYMLKDSNLRTVSHRRFSGPISSTTRTSKQMAQRVRFELTCRDFRDGSLASCCPTVRRPLHNAPF